MEWALNTFFFFFFLNNYSCRPIKVNLTTEWKVPCPMFLPLVRAYFDATFEWPWTRTWTYTLAFLYFAKRVNNSLRENNVDIFSLSYHWSWQLHLHEDCQINVKKMSYMPTIIIGLYAGICPYRLWTSDHVLISKLWALKNPSRFTFCFVSYRPAKYSKPSKKKKKKKKTFQNEYVPFPRDTKSVSLQKIKLNEGSKVEKKTLIFVKSIDK